MRRLVVNADDFGLTLGINRGIVQAHTNGIVTSATLMAHASAFEDAVRRANSTPNLSVGCHVVLVDGTPLLNSAQVSTLTDGARPEHFERSLGRFAMNAIRGRISSEQVEAEVVAQIRKLQAAGVHVSHLDTHKHTHIFPQVLQPLLRAAKTCGLRAIRNPFGQVAVAIVANRPNLWMRYGQIKVLNTLAGRFRRATSSAGLLTTDGIVGILGTGKLDQRMLRSLLESLPEGTWEFVCHPGYNDAELQNVRTRLRESRDLELQLLTSAELRELITKSGIQLISYRDLLYPNVHGPRLERQLH